MKALQTYFLFFSFSLFSTTLLAGTEDFMRSTGKIYAVVGVLVVIFIGLMIFLIRLDRRVRKMEEKINQ